jgi:hypothetical protein
MQKNGPDHGSAGGENFDEGCDDALKSIINIGLKQRIVILL